MVTFRQPHVMDVCCDVVVNGFRLQRVVKKEEQKLTENTKTSYFGINQPDKGITGDRQSFQLHTKIASVVGFKVQTIINMHF